MVVFAAIILCLIGATASGLILYRFLGLSPSSRMQRRRHKAMAERLANLQQAASNSVDDRKDEDIEYAPAYFQEEVAGLNEEERRYLAGLHSQLTDKINLEVFFGLCLIVLANMRPARRLKVTELRLDQSFISDLGYDSLNVLTAAMDAMDFTGVHIPDEAIEKLSNLGDVVSYLAAHKVDRRNKTNA